VPGNSAVGGGTSVGSRGSSSAAVSDDGPKEGDRNAEGLVFRNSRWHREDRPEEREEEIGQHVGNGTTKNGRNVSFVPNRYGVMSGGETTIIIDPAKLDQASYVHISWDGIRAENKFSSVNSVNQNHQYEKNQYSVCVSSVPVPFLHLCRRSARADSGS
jgi:hypothetical protein